MTEYLSPSVRLQMEENERNLSRMQNMFNPISPSARQSVRPSRSVTRNNSPKSSTGSPLNKTKIQEFLIGPKFTYTGWINKVFIPALRNSSLFEYDADKVDDFVEMARVLNVKLDKARTSYPKIIEIVQLYLESMILGSIYLVKFMDIAYAKNALIEYLELCFNCIYVFPVVTISTVVAVDKLNKVEEFFPILGEDIGLKMDYFFETGEYGYEGKCNPSTPLKYCQFVDPLKYLNTNATNLMEFFFGKRKFSMRSRLGVRKNSRLGFRKKSKAPQRRKSSHRSKKASKPSRKTSRKTSRKQSRVSGRKVARK